MVVAKWMQIRTNDKVIVFQFFDENGGEVGSRGISITDDEMKALSSIPFGDMINYKVNGVTIPDKLDDNADVMTKLAYKAYQEYLQAKQQEEEQKNQVIEM